MPTREDAENLRKETERIRNSRLERERAEEEERRRTEQREQDDHVRRQDHTNLDDVHRSTRRLDELNGRLLWHRARLENWEERNVQFRDASAWNVVGHLAGVAGLAGCVVADTIILSTPSRLLSRGFRESVRSTIGAADWTVPAVAFVFSVSYFAAEFFIGYQLGGTRRSAVGPVSDRAFAIIAWVTLPILTFAYTLINTGLLSNDPFRTVGPATVAGGITASLALGTVALIVHGFVLYYSDAIALGFAFIYYKVGQLIIRFRINRTVRRVSRLAAEAETGFRRFVDDFRAANNGNGRDPGPFSETATRVINDLYDSEVIEEPKKRRSRNGDQSGGDAGPAACGEAERGADIDDRDASADNGSAQDDADGPPRPEEPANGFNWEDEDEVRG